MKILTILFLALLSLGGCASRSGFFAPDVLEEKALAFTQKAEIYNSLEIKASLVATYLNPLLKAYQNDKRAHFLMSVFIDDDYSDPDKQGLFNPDYTITLNGQKPISIKPLDNEDDLLKIAPVKNVWSHYYLVTFPKPATAKMELLLKSQRYGASSLVLEAE
ncbi:MAG: hypothetical protein DSZ05_07930 [Sulfurospirillum sp.]|nr:MAG: hypothetical protein DSZ05_07930 [Sulfurospirillum sp.]